MPCTADLAYRDPDIDPEGAARRRADAYWRLAKEDAERRGGRTSGLSEVHKDPPFRPEEER